MILSRRKLNLGIALTCCYQAISPTTRNLAAQEVTNRTGLVVAAAKQLLESFDSKQREKAQLPFDDERRTSWHFVPLPTRKGLALRDMKEDQVKLALKLLSLLLSEEGFKRSVDTLNYEGIILEHEGIEHAERRSYLKYYVTIYGTPSNDSEWGFSIEGHHLSLNFTFDKGVIVDSTPQFYGVNPAKLPKSYTVPSVNPIGSKVVYKEEKRLLSAEEDAGFAMLKCLNDVQLAKATFNQKAPRDILWPGVAQPQTIDPVGVPAVELDVDQKKILMNLIESFQLTMPEEVVLSRMNLISASGLDTVWFAWAGSTERGSEHYYRLQGPAFIAEYCNVQKDSAGNTANHVHSVWRDLTGDFNLPVVAAAK